MVRIYDMKQKEVINVTEGIRFGFISDVEIDEKTGKIVNLIVPGPGRVLGMFGREKEYQIKWDRIKTIGDDLIIVDVETEDILVSSE